MFNHPSIDHITIPIVTRSFNCSFTIRVAPTMIAMIAMIRLIFIIPYSSSAGLYGAPAFIPAFIGPNELVE